MALTFKLRSSVLTLVVALSVACGGGPALANPELNEALIKASEEDKVEVVKALIDAGADVNTQGKYGTVLDRASAKGHAEIVRILIDTGADVNAKSHPVVGGTALMSASYFAHTEIVRMLIDAGADVNAKTVTGWTALNSMSLLGYTFTEDHREIVELLKAAGATE